jgi:predicted PurR-regulated permease PerM
VAVTVVVVLALLVILGLVVAFVRPLVVEGQKFAEEAPRYLRDARAGRGWAGGLIRRFDLDDRLREQSGALKGSIGRLGSQSIHVLGAVGSAIASVVTVFVLTFLMLLEGPALSRGAMQLVPRGHRERASRIGSQSSKAIAGYLLGNLIISAIAGILTYVFLLIAGVPFKGVLALWVAFADLLPLVGATLGAAVVIAVAFVHSPAVGIAAVVFFVVYQQLENHLLQPGIQARTVHLNPLAVFVAVLAGVELAGILGALLAIPVGAIVQIVGRELWELRHPVAGVAPGSTG